MLKDIKKTEYIDFMYRLLLQNHFIEMGGEKEAYENAMYKMLFSSNSKKQKSIRSSFQEIGIILNADDNTDTFLFYLVYFTLINTDRSFMNEEGGKKPNQKIISYIKKINHNFWWIGSQYLLLYDTYIKSENSSQYFKEEKEKQLIIKFNRQLLFFHHTYLNKSEYKFMIKEVGSKYENAYITRYKEEYKYLIERYRLLMELVEVEKFDFFDYYCITFRSYIEGEKDWEVVVETKIDLDNMLYELLFCSKWIRKIYDLVEINSFLKGQSLRMNKDIYREEEYNYLKKYCTLYAEATSCNNFILVGSYLMVCQEIKEFKEQMEILKVLQEHISKQIENNKEDKEDIVWSYNFCEYDIDKIATGELLDFIISDKSQRKASDRNVIRKRIKLIRTLLKYINICQNYSDIRDIKMMYQEFYIERSNLLNTKKYATILGIFENNEINRLEKKDLIFLEEIYIALKFQSKNKRRAYIEYNKRKQNYLKSFMSQVFLLPFHIKV